MLGVSLFIYLQSPEDSTPGDMFCFFNNVNPKQRLPYNESLSVEITTSMLIIGLLKDIN